VVNRGTTAKKLEASVKTTSVLPGSTKKMEAEIKLLGRETIRLSRRIEEMEIMTELRKRK